MNRLKVMLLALLMAIPVWAEKKKEYYLYGGICNELTRESLMNARVRLLRADSTVVDSSRVGGGGSINGREDLWFLDVPLDGADYILHATCEGYEERYVNLSTKKKSKRLQFEYWGELALKKKARVRELGAATVRATKIKFYSRGDTIVYNADAFELAEGSMLDALIEQLPNVELKDDGQIYVNGKHVDELLLNGDPFFAKDRTVMLENLPAYMVKQVKVYHKQSDLSEFLKRKMDEGSYVMDVKLKKEYSQGWVANAEAGGGTKDRFLGQLFALRFTDHSRVALVGNLNNLNDTRRPGRDTQWTPEQMPSGRRLTRLVGLDYSVKDRMRRYNIEGNTTMKREHYNNWQQNTSEWFMPTGNTFGRSESRGLSRNTNFSSYHKLKLGGGEMNNMYDFSTNLTYNRRSGWNESASATFIEDVSAMVSDGLMDSIRQPQAGELLRRLAANRTLSERQSSGHSLGTTLHANQYHKVGADHFYWYGGISYNTQRDESSTHRLTDYPSSTKAGSDEHIRSQDRPNNNLNYDLGGWYTLHLDKWNLTAGYNFAHNNTHHDYERMLLQDNASGAALLPSMAEAYTRDWQNSYLLHQQMTSHAIYTQMSYQLISKKNTYTMLLIDYTIPFVHHRLDYTRAYFDGAVRRNTCFFNPMVMFHHRWKSWSREIRFQYRPSSNIPELTNLVEMERNADPLNIYLGNPNLKNAHHHHLQLYFRSDSEKRRTNVSSTLNYSITKDAHAMGYTYDQQTGIRHYKPTNVNGNYNLNGSLNFSKYLDHNKHLRASSNSYLQFLHGMDLLGMQRSSVNTWWATENLHLEYSKKKLTLAGKGNLSWNRSTSRREGFQDVTVWDFNYGMTARLTLPHNFGVSTDITMYSRRGYDNPASNRNDLCWNARVSKRLPKQNVTFLIDGFDLLHQLSNLTQTMNSQGRFETYRNALPSYFLAHVIWRLNKEPKKMEKQ